MALPQTRDQFKKFCLSQLGDGVIDINISDVQVENNVDLALQFWQDYHYQAKVKIYAKHVITADEINNNGIILPDSITDVTQVFVADTGISAGIFSLRYQLHLNDLYDLSSTTLSNYLIAQQYVNTIQDTLTPQSQIRFQQYSHKINFDADLIEKFTPGQFIIIEAYAKIDPDTYPDVWTNRTLINLCTAYLKKQWGSNLIKYKGLQLPGGTMLDGLTIYNMAVQEIQQLEAEFISKYQDPDYLFIA